MIVLILLWKYTDVVQILLFLLLYSFIWTNSYC